MTGCTTPESPLTVWATSWLYALGCSGAEEDEGFDDADDALDDPSSPASLRRALASIDFVDASKLARLEKMGVRGSKDLLWLSEADVASLRLRTIEARKLMWLCDRMRAEMAESPASGSGARAAVTQVVLPPPQWEHTDAEGKKTLAQRAQEQQHRRAAPAGGDGGAPTLAEAKAAMGEQWSLLTVEEQAAILCNKVIPVQFVAPGEAAKHASTPSKVAGGGKENAAPPDARTYDEMMRAVPPSVPTGKRYSTTKSTRAVRAQNASKSEISTADAAADERNGLSTL